MTDDDVLSLHVDAVRQRSLVLGDASETQERIVASLRARRRRKQRLLRSLIGAGFVLSVGSTSYALIQGMPPALRPLLSSIGLTVKPPIERAVPRKRPVDLTPTIAAPAVPDVASATPEPTPTPASELPPTESSERSNHTIRSRAGRTAAAPNPQPAPSVDSPESDEELSRRLYARAHQLHFVARDREAALRAWDDYLARAPLQTLRIEAEYNRALCLVRLGRTEEALRELTPFANGTHGAYRRREAAALIQALTR